MKLRRSGTIALLAVLAIAHAAPATAKVSPSNYCVAIAVSSEAAEGLAQRFDSLARALNLEIDDSSPSMRLYYPAGEGVTDPTDSTVLMILNRMGPFGSILSHHPLRGDPSPDLPGAFARFVRDEIVGDYGVRNCADIEGFTAPVIYH